MIPKCSDIGNNDRSILARLGGGFLCCSCMVLGDIQLAAIGMGGEKPLIFCCCWLLAIGLGEQGAWELGSSLPPGLIIGNEETSSCTKTGALMPWLL